MKNKTVVVCYALASLLVALNFFIVNNKASATSITSNWSKTVPSGPNIILAEDIAVLTNDGSSVIGNSGEFGFGKADFRVLKLNIDGEIMWQRAFGASGNDSLNSITVTSDNGFLLTGHTDSFNGPEHQGDAYVMKIDSSGAIEWQRSVGDGANRVNVGTTLRETADGNYILSGWTDASGAGLADFWVVKLAYNGTVIWANTYGGTAFDEPNALQITPDGGAILAGRSFSSFGNGFCDALVLKLDANGAVDWAKAVGTKECDIAYSIHLTSNNEYVLGGFTNVLDSNGDGWIANLDSDGNIVWQNRYGASERDVIYDVKPTTGGGYVFTGETQSFGNGGSDLWLVKLTSTGIVEWERAVGGTEADKGYSVLGSPLSGYFLAGATESYGLNGAELLAIKVDDEGLILDCTEFVTGSGEAQTLPFMSKTVNDLGESAVAQVAPITFSTKDLSEISTSTCNEEPCTSLTNSIYLPFIVSP